jgi:hypothetical protein
MDAMSMCSFVAVNVTALNGIAPAPWSGLSIEPLHAPPALTR